MRFVDDWPCPFYPLVDKPEPDRVSCNPLLPAFMPVLRGLFFTCLVDGFKFVDVSFVPQEVAMLLVELQEQSRLLVVLGL